MKDGPKSARGKSKSKGTHPKLAERKPVIWGITKIDNDNGEIGKRFVDSLIQWLER
jgi:hypothetical protein